MGLGQSDVQAPDRRFAFCRFAPNWATATLLK